MRHKVFQAVRDLRKLANIDDTSMLDFDILLPLHFPVVICILPALYLESVSAWFQARNLAAPYQVLNKYHKRLRGGIIAQEGRGIIFIDGMNTPADRRYTLAHEAGHFFLDHFIPRRDLAMKYGASVIDIIDGKRQPTQTERVEAILSRITLTAYTHLLGYEDWRGHSHGTTESAADQFALESLAPIKAVLTLLPTLYAHSGEVIRIADVLVERFDIPRAIADIYAPRICCKYGKHVDLRMRFGL